MGAGVGDGVGAGDAGLDDDPAHAIVPTRNAETTARRTEDIRTSDCMTSNPSVVHDVSHGAIAAPRRNTAIARVGDASVFRKRNVGRFAKARRTAGAFAIVDVLATPIAIVETRDTSRASDDLVGSVERHRREAMFVSATSDAREESRGHAGRLVCAVP